MHTLSGMILRCFPKSVDCVNGHVGQTIWSWYFEQDGDRGYLTKVPRCGHCNMPNGPDDDASFEDRAAYYRSEEPKPSMEVAIGQNTK